MDNYYKQIFLIIAALFHLTMLYPEKAVRGTLDLTRADFTNNYYRLDGEWKLYRDTFLLPDISLIHATPDYVTVPSLINPANLHSPFGKATFRLTLTLTPEKGRVLQIRLKRVISSYTLFVNGKKVLQCGRPGVNAGDSIPNYAPQSVTVPAEGDTLELMIHFSNYNELAGSGIYQTVIIGTPDLLNRKLILKYLFDIFIVGCLIMTGLYHIVLFFFRKSDYSPLLLGVYCLLLGVRPLFLDYVNLYIIFDRVPWNILYRLEIFTIVGSSPILSIFLREIFPKEIDRRVINLYIIISGVLGTGLFVLPSPYFSYTLIVHSFTTAIMGIYVLCNLFVGAVKGTDGAAYFFIGFFIFFLTILHDILYANGIINGDFLLSYGMFIFTFFQAMIIAERFAKKFNKTETLSRELLFSQIQQKEINERLEVAISERKEELKKEIEEKEMMKEELRKKHKLEAIGILAGGIAHDFNNLLTIIMGNLFLARQLSVNEEVILSLNDAEQAGVRATDLANQLLTFSRGGSPVKKVTSIKDIIKTTTEFSLRGSNVLFSFDFARDLYNCDVDVGQISQVISNIVINAKQAMSGGGSLFIQAYNQEIDGAMAGIFPGHYVVIVITDTGKGIPEEIIGNIFDPFFTTKETGKGLGLSICYSIIHKHNGTIKVASQAGQGTTFTIYLPATKQEAVANNLPDTGEISGNGEKILVIDDEPNILLVVEKMLTELGFQVDTTTNPTEGISLYKDAYELKQSYFCTIIDLTIPGSTGGTEILKNLCQINPEIKAIASSGYSNDPVMSTPDKFGFSAILKKPYGIAELKMILKNIMDMRVAES